MFPCWNKRKFADSLRDDALLAVAVGKRDLVGAQRLRARDQGHALAGKSTLNRLELTLPDSNRRSRYKKVVYVEEEIEQYFVDVFMEAHPTPPRQIVIDLDATDGPVHGNQEGRFFHGYYGHYCYLPLYLFCGDDLLVAKLRPSNIDGAAGALEELQRVVTQIRARWPKVRVVIRGDSGFARDEIMTWCEENGVKFVLGLAHNTRLEEMLVDEMEEARQEHERTGQPARRFRDFRYRTLNSWSRERRAVGKAEHLPRKTNPRFVVTSFGPKEHAARPLYEDLYCARGDMENRIKGQQLEMFADRTSTSTMGANQVRLWLSSLAYVLVNALRRSGL